jgi:hypothetical protein
MVLDLTHNRFDFSSIEVNISGLIYKGIKSISYDDQLTPGNVYGTTAMRLGRTRGQYETAGSLEVYKEEFALLSKAIAAIPPGGLAEVPFVVTVMYAELLAPITVDILGGVRITKVDDSHSSGSDALTVKLTIDPLWISRDGVFLVSPPALLK